MAKVRKKKVAGKKKKEGKKKSTEMDLGSIINQALFLFLFLLLADRIDHEPGLVLVDWKLNRIR